MTDRRVKSLALVLSCVVALAGCDLFVSPDRRVDRAREDIARGDYLTAVIELKSALESDPGYMDAHLLLAQTSLHLGDAPGAEKELRRAREAGASPEQLAQLTAETWLALGDADKLLQQVGTPELPLAEPERSIYRGEALLALGQADAAVEALDTIQAGSILADRAAIGRARARALQGRTDESLRLLDALPRESPLHAAALLARGQILATQGRFADARGALQSAHELRAQLSVIQQGTLLAALAESALAIGDVNSARTHLQGLVQLAPNAPAALLLASRIAMAEQDYTTAVAALQRLVAAMPDFSPARLLLGAALVAQGNLNQAELQLTRAVQVSPENLEARKLLANVRLRLGHPDAVLSLLAPLQGDSDADVNTLLGLAHLQMGDAGAALSSIERGAADRPSDRARQIELASTYVQMRRYPQAIATLRALAHADGDARREMLLVVSVSALEGFPAGDAELNRLVSQHPRDSALLNAAANYFAQRGEFDRARTLVGRALAVKADDAASMLNSARIEYAAGDMPAAKARLQGLLAAHPGYAAARMSLAEMAMRESDLAGAAAVIEPLRAGDPRAVEPRLALARIYLLGARQKDAGAVLVELDKLSAGNAAVGNAIGQLYLDAGRYDEAGAYFKKAIEMDRDNAQYWLNQARVQLALDRRVLARESLEHALARNPESAMIVAALTMLDLREGKAAAGAQRIAALRKARPEDPALLALEGDFHAANRDYAAASRAFDAALKIKPSAAVSVRAYLARRDGRLRDVTVPLEQWVEQQPDDFTVQSVLAEAYALGGQRRRAIEKYELIADKGPANPAVLNNLAWLYHEADDERATSIAQRAFEIDPANTEIADTYGWILVSEGRVDEGLKILKPIAEKGGPNIQFHYAAALARGGDVAGARERLKPLVAGEPFAAQGDARRLLQELSTR